MKQPNLITFPELLSQCNCTDIDGITSFDAEIPSGSYIFEIADNLAATRLETGLKIPMSRTNAAGSSNQKNLLPFDPYIIIDTKRMEDVLESADYEFRDAVAKGQPFLIDNFNRAEHDICEYLIKTARAIGCPSIINKQ